MSYFDEGGTLPPPFNIIPSPKSVWYLCVWLHCRLCGHGESRHEDECKHGKLKEFTVMHFILNAAWVVHYSLRSVNVTHPLTKENKNSIIAIINSDF